jgi:hypothetical protein
MKNLFILLTLSLFISPLFAQEDTLKPVTSKPVRFTFGTTTLIDNSTIETPYKGGLELEISHRFSLIDNYHDLFGIYGSANTRIGLNYGITDRLMIGAGTTLSSGKLKITVCLFHFHIMAISWQICNLHQISDPPPASGRFTDYHTSLN